MRGRVGPLTADIWLGESERFTSPLLLVHGLWETAAVWRAYAGFLNHRGWRCIAVELRGREGGDAPTLAGHSAELRAAISALDAPPVLLGHDLGALLALQVAPAARAVIALAPLLPVWLDGASARALRRAGNWFSRRRGAGLTAPAGRWRSAYPRAERGQREAARTVRELCSGNVSLAPIPPGVPGIVVVGTRDPLVPVDAGERLAAHVGAEFRSVADSGHPLPIEKSWQVSALNLHRWIVQRLGAPLLEFYEEEASD